MSLITRMSLFSVLVAALVGSSAAFAPAPVNVRQPVAMASAASGEEFYIDQNRRNLMNLILVGSAGVTIGGLAVPYILFFLPPSAGGGGGGTPAKDALGNDLLEKDYLASKKVGDHSLAQGLKGDATYLIIKDDGKLEEYGLNAVCTHLGCVVPWSAANNKFMCPCHGSQYAPTGAVVRGPAPLPLALAHIEIGESGNILFNTWSETDFRTEKKPWWI
jgi:cytochrome b6-f complex iron-sulfur subunit